MINVAGTRPSLGVKVHCDHLLFSQSLQLRPEQVDCVQCFLGALIQPARVVPCLSGAREREEGWEREM